MNKFKISSELIINASPKTVWNILMDFESYPTWNPFITSISGIQKEGGILRAKICPPGAKEMVFNPNITRMEAPFHFSWKGKFLIKGLFDGEHHFEIRPLADGKVKFIQSEDFSGLLVPLFKKSLLEKTISGFQAMNEALKMRCERV